MIPLPKEHHESLSNVSEVVVPFDGRLGVERDVAEELHPHDRVDEEQHHHQHHHVWKSLREGEIWKMLT